MRLPLDDVKFRTDLYPRIPLGLLCPDTCPENLRDLDGAYLEGGVLYPLGTVADHFIRLQRERDIGEASDQHVYFIQSSNGGPVKIGLARCPEARLASLQTAHPYPLNLIGVIPGGGRNRERLLHERFAPCRLNGEWFDVTSQEVEEIIHEAGA